MKNGFTTGSCAAAASKAACWMLLSGKRKSHVEIETPKGDVFKAELCDISIGETEVSCGVIKDGGDDPDITTGAYGDSSDRDERYWTPHYQYGSFV